MWVRVFDLNLSLLGPKGKLRELGDRVWVGSGASSLPLYTSSKTNSCSALSNIGIRISKLCSRKKTTTQKSELTTETHNQNELFLENPVLSGRKGKLES
jgi:hypothetical protein